MSDSKIVLVTGAGTGLGRAVTVALSAAGHRVVAAGRTRETLEATVAASPGTGSAHAIVADVTDPDSVRGLFAQIEERWGRLDALFNNAGLFGAPRPVEQVSVQDWRRVVDTNLTGSFLCAQAAFGLMRRQRPGGGRIINNGSISAHVPRPYAVAYTATKHAVTGLTKALALEGRAHDIPVGQIDIGNAATEMTAGISTGAPQPDGSVRPEPTFDAAHVAGVIRQQIELPLDVNVPFLTIAATGMPYLGRG